MAVLMPLKAQNSSPSRPTLAEPEFQKRYSEWKDHRDDATRIERAHETFFRRSLSSAQVRRLAQGIIDEDQRVEFLVSAYPATVDPENFYEVYDAFTSFSRVFRLHDRIKALRAVPNGPLTSQGPQPLTPGELREMSVSLGQEPFDNRRLALLKVIEPKAKNRIATAQVGELLDLFAFENNRLEAARVALHWVRDPENLYLLAAKFNFNNTKDQLTRAIAARNHTGDRPR